MKRRNVDELVQRDDGIDVSALEARQRLAVLVDDRAKVLDLGLALVQGEAPADREVVGGVGYVVGTMDYIAPEQAENAARVDPSCDIYSLGCSLFFALTGQPPFPGGTTIEIVNPSGPRY